MPTGNVTFSITQNISSLLSISMVIMHRWIWFHSDRPTSFWVMGWGDPKNLSKFKGALLPRSGPRTVTGPHPWDFSGQSTYSFAFLSRSNTDFLSYIRKSIFYFSSSDIIVIAVSIPVLYIQEFPALLACILEVIKRSICAFSIAIKS